MIAAEQAEYRRAILDAAELSIESSLATEISWSNPEVLLEKYDGVIIGGSGEFDLHSDTPAEPKVVRAREILTRLTPMIEHMIKQDFPLLGICFGHQLIGEARGGEVTSDPSQKKVGSYEVQLTEAGKTDYLFSDLPSAFTAQYGHHNSLTRLPRGATLLASSTVCKFSALRYSAHIYTTQFHPELSRKDVVFKLENSPGYLPEQGSSAVPILDSPEASRVIPLFIEKIVTSNR